MTRLIQLLGALLGVLLGFVLGLLVLERLPGAVSLPNRPAFLMAMVAATFLFGYLAIPYVTIYPARRAVDLLAQLGAGDFALAVAGVLVGLLMGLLVGVPLSALGDPWGTALPLLVTVLLAVIMLGAVMLKRQALLAGVASLLPGGQRRGSAREVLIDTSAGIDGRIVDIGRTGFILGRLTVPRFVLDELQRIADSPDTMRRNRGRRGLEMLAALQKDSISPVTISEVGYPELGDVDAQLIAYAHEHQAAILTNDYNLNRVAELQGIRVLNINELANAVKSVVHPGEELKVRIIQEGKEPGQGVGYLEDGTMIVVEGGGAHMERELSVTVTRVLQTVAGRMIFAQPREGA